MKFSINYQDMKFSLIVSFSVSLGLAALCFFVYDTGSGELNTAYQTTLDTLSIFSLTFLGFIVTSFTVFQLIHTKDWF